VHRLPAQREVAADLSRSTLTIASSIKVPNSSSCRVVRCARPHARGGTEATTRALPTETRAVLLFRRARSVHQAMSDFPPFALEATRHCGVGSTARSDARQGLLHKLARSTQSASA